MFYKMKHDSKYPDLWKNDKVIQSQRIVCPQYPGHQRGVRTAWSLSLMPKSSRIGDFGNTVTSEWLVTDEVACALKESSFTGYDFRPVDLCNNKIKSPLWELFITGKGGEAHPDAGIIKTYYCASCGQTNYRAFTNGIGIIVDESNWDGSDFFTITAYPKFVLVTQRIKDFIEKKHWKGVLFVKSTELLRDERYGDTVSPF